MKQIIFDCDSTAGIPGYPMDDALALFYLLGRPQEAEVLAVTCTFGNGTTEQVYRASRDLLSEAGWERLPVICGSSQGEEPVSDAARFIVEETRKKPGELSFVGIGSLTNLYGASLLDPGIFDRRLYSASIVPWKPSGRAEFFCESRGGGLGPEPWKKYIHSDREQYPGALLSSKRGILYGHGPERSWPVSGREAGIPV